MATQQDIDRLEAQIVAAEKEQQRLERALAAPQRGTDVQALQAELRAATANTVALRRQKADAIDRMRTEQTIAGRR
jgi:predicted secreted Zn-dependent protease